MADRRMFAKTIIDSDVFLDMPSSSQALYFHLGMRADDEGFINNTKKIQRVVGASDDDLKLLIAKRFVIPFETGIIVIKHWKLHNYIRKDRMKETVYTAEKALLREKENGSYSLCQPTGNQLATNCQHRLGKDRLGKVSLDKDSIEDKPPTVFFNSVIDYLNEKADKNYRATSKENRKYIQARFNEGFTLDDFKKVIDNKVADWDHDPTKGEKDMRPYLRPETLFGTKFESYLNAKPVVNATAKRNNFKQRDYDDDFFKKLQGM